eukprot:3304313-Alexandrium_andersonii.AAC.1
MSASLVGSEMCIRDSVLLRPPRLRVRLMASNGFTARPAVASSFELFPACLLYTSDAADDM